jgi:hypothetical protein
LGRHASSWLTHVHGAAAATLQVRLVDHGHTISPELEMAALRCAAVRACG